MQKHVALLSIDLIDAQKVYAGIQSVLDGRASDFTYDYPCHDAVQQRWFIMRMAKVLGNEALYINSHHETTGSKLQLVQANAVLLKTSEYTQAILDHMADGVTTLDALGMIQSFNHAACNMFGYTSKEMVGRNITSLVDGPQRGPLLEHLRATFATNGQMANLETTGLRRMGETFPLSLSLSQASHFGEPIVITVMRDVTQQHLDTQEIRHLAFFDALTGLPNRRLLMDRLSRSIVMSGRSGKHSALMFLDLDYFKRLNDTLGHHVGDQLLQQVGQRLQTCVREGDSVALLGGDEFVVLLEELSEYSTKAASHAKAVAHKILLCLGQPYDLRDMRYTCTSSIGIAIYGKTAETVEDLLKKADVAMYQAKVQARAELEHALRLGLQRHEFVVHYQAQVRGAAAGEPVTIGAEALVRWQHPQFGMLSPTHFIAVAEDTGLIVPLGQWVMQTVCRQLAIWSKNPATCAWTLSVNISARQFAQPEFVDQVRNALSSSGATPRLLTLELTERLLLENMDDAIAQMQALKSGGVRLSLDDFGTGYSCLTCLKRLPIDEVKIDPSFVNEQRDKPSEVVIVKTIVSLGHSLGLHVIAEGIETQTQLQILSAMGCDAFQGYYFAKPCAIEMIPFS